MIGNPADEFAEFQRRFLTDARRAATGQAAVSGSAASDSSGTVTVFLNRVGQVDSVRLTAEAKRVLGLGGIGPSIHEAVQAAVAARLTTWAEAFTDDDAARTSRSGVSSDLSAVERQSSREPAVALPSARIDGFAAEFERLTAGRNLDSAGVRSAMYELLELLERVDRTLDAATERSRTAAAARYSGVSPDRHVHVTVAGNGELVEVHSDSRWLREAHEINIGRQITSAFHAAYQAVARNGVTAPFDTGEIGQIRSLLRDPAHLARMLRLDD